MKLPATGWVTADEGSPLDMSVVRAHFASIGENLVGDFVTRQMKQGWARTKNRTCLDNFGYWGPDPLQVIRDRATAAAEEVSAKAATVEDVADLTLDTTVHSRRADVVPTGPVTLNCFFGPVCLNF